MLHAGRGTYLKKKKNQYLEGEDVNFEDLSFIVPKIFGKYAHGTMRTQKISTSLNLIGS